jgi:hypothetical protein
MEGQISFRRILLFGQTIFLDDVADRKYDLNWPEQEL